MLKESTKGHLFIDADLKGPFFIIFISSCTCQHAISSMQFDSRLAEVLGVGRLATIEGKCQWNNFKHDPIPDDSLDVLKFPLRPCK